MAAAQSRTLAASSAELHLRIVSPNGSPQSSVPAAVWLMPLEGTPARPFLPHGPYTLLQKKRTFLPHLQVIPAGSVVQFPNADPFFHNVFSLFDGKRFDLGLYEAGSSKSVTFSRVGVSYIFCNIHPEMSAVVLALSTPLYALADASNAVDLRDIPPGDYSLNFWIEGVPQMALSRLSQQLHLAPGRTDLRDLKAPISRKDAIQHSNEFGMPYVQEPEKPY
ncbi:hypothetical protein [Acidipila sp. EB88]|uniref:hypothetical protein n=1 Tax=Acidipila sp. EB88 TaxID=2305226 RepID=UPI001F1EDADC|nr:hypothetical protein [Acidipila sp. EB88]